MAGEKFVCGRSLGQWEPGEEGAVRACAGDGLEHVVAAPLVDSSTFFDGVLGTGERGDAGALDRLVDADAVVMGEELEAGDDLRVADDEAEPPARHAVALRHGEHLDTDLFGPWGCEEALRRGAVEDEVGVGEVVDDGGTGLVRVGDRFLEDAVGRGRGARVGWVVEEEGSDVVARSEGEVGREVRFWVEHDADLDCPCESYS